MPPIKELHFFDHLYIPDNRKWTHGHIKKGVTDALKWHVEQGAINLDHFKYLVNLATEEPFSEAWYRNCFNRPTALQKVLGDITPEYSTLPVEGVEYVRNLLGADLKLIYMIRNPLERALSQLRMNLTRRGHEHENDGFWLEAAKDPVILQRGDYCSYIPRWEQVFPKENILYLPYKQVKDDPTGLLATVEKHLGLVQHAGYNGIGNRVHRTKEARVPKSSIAYLEDALAPQVHFLKERFGGAFYSMT